MKIDLTKLNNEIVTSIDIEEVMNFDEKLIDSQEIQGLENVNVKGTITKNSTGDNVLNISVDGTMILEDAISLDMVSYPFSFKIEDEMIEKDKNDENTLDIIEVLWQNIMLEVPLKFTKVENLSEFHGNGWKLISEDELKEENNPFNDLKSLIGEE